MSLKSRDVDLYAAHYGLRKPAKEARISLDDVSTGLKCSGEWDALVVCGCGAYVNIYSHNILHRTRCCC